MEKDILGYVSVDSGQIIIVDPCYLASWKDGEYNPDEKLDNHYAKACELTVSKKLGGEMLVSGIAGNAVASSTFDGDGSYPVYAKRDKDGRIKELTIKFTR